MINFYSPRGNYGCFSNFSNHPVVMKGKTWPTSEHYFQAMKFEGTRHEETVRLCDTPAQAAKMGRTRSLPLRSDWEDVKDAIMYDACLAKFTQHDDIRQTLINTGIAHLCEHTSNDHYWGDGGDGSGRNQLGITLMAVRDALQQSA